MTEAKNTRTIENVERRSQEGTWPWFVLNVILFPAPAYLTLLRVKDFSFGENMQHFGVTFLLFLILLVSALLQLVLPGVGRIWMLFPFLSGIVILYASRSLKEDFKPFDFSPVIKTQKAFIIVFVLLFTVLSIIPTLDLIEMNPKSIEIYKSWIAELPHWQEVLILVLSLLLLFGGYVINSSTTVSINRAFILYACFTVFTNQILIILLLTSEWLKIQGGFWMRLMAALLAAILALDYWDAKTFGQYTRRYFFLTCTKGLSFVFLWLCFFGLPQKSASVFADFYYKKVRPAAIQYSHSYLIFNERDRFESAHEATRRMRALYAKAFINPKPGELSKLTNIINGSKDTVILSDTDICRLTDLIDKRELRSTTMDFERLPLFRPIQEEWDVMLTALLLQGAISETDLDKYIAGFKAMLPKTSHGKLPEIDTPYEARYVSMATGLRSDFIPPRFEHIEHLLKNNFYPVLSLRLAGINYWAALLYIDQESGIVWFRLEATSGMQKSIKLLFDSNESEAFRNEILSRFIVPVSLDYFRNALAHNSAPVVIFSKNGLAEAMPDRFVDKNLAAINRAVAVSSGSERSAVIIADPIEEKLFVYARYIRAVSQVEFTLKPEAYGRNLLPGPASASVYMKGVGRLNEIDVLLESISPLCDRDRIDIAYLMVKNNHVYGAPDLFIKLATGKPVLSDLITCRSAFMIGRQLFLLGYHKEAFDYLEVAFMRHPFDSEYELWYHITMAKLKRRAAAPLYSPLNQQPHLSLYYRTVTDVQNGNEKAAMKRLEKALEKDSRDSLANHLLNRYFNRPLDDRHFFPAQEGL